MEGAVLAFSCRDMTLFSKFPHCSALPSPAPVAGDGVSTHLYKPSLALAFRRHRYAPPKKVILENIPECGKGSNVAQAGRTKCGLGSIPQELLGGNILGWSLSDVEHPHSLQSYTSKVRLVSPRTEIRQGVVFSPGELL